jgi:hypothetical protein
MPDVRGGSAADEARIRNAIDEVLRRLTREITDDELQSCIRRKATAPDTVVFIGGDECFSYVRGYTTWWRIGPFRIKSDEVHICLGNIDRQGTVPAATLMHELAHTCCWDDGEGKGVPEWGRFRLP